MKYLFLSILSFMMLFLACKQKDNSTNDVTKPVITVVAPAASDTIILSNEPEIHIEFTATDNAGLSSLTVQLLDASNTVLNSVSPDVSHLMVYPFHQHYAPVGITTATTMHVNIMATDLTGNTENLVIDFIVAP